jgi:hypothetical protein
MNTRNTAILLGLLLKAQAMTPVCLLFGRDAYKDDLSAVLTSLVLALVLSAVERFKSVWKLVLFSTLLTACACYAELSWVAHVGKLGPPFSRYGIFSTTVFVGMLYLGMGSVLALCNQKQRDSCPPE